MKISAMTLGCPTWDLDTICDRLPGYGFDGVDFRGLQDEIDITKTPQFTSGISESKRKLSDAGLGVSGISSSISVCAEGDFDDRVDEAKRTIAVALELDCPNVRVFGNGDVEAHGREHAADQGRKCLEAILNLDGAAHLNWLFETHDHWIKAQDVQLLLDRIDHPSFGVLWDMGHTARVGGESPQQSWAAVGSRIRYAHVKDAVYEPEHENAMKDGWRYVTPGAGELPLAESIKILKDNGYDGWLLFEHEKRWHPTLPEPEEIFPKFVDWVRSLIA